MLTRIFITLYGLVCYAIGIVAIAYAVGFVGNLVVPKTIDSSEPADLQTALLFNLPLLGLFAIQHSVMARQGFKKWWTQVVPKAAERSTYVLFSGLSLILLYWLWQPLPQTVWSITSEPLYTGLYVVYFAGWGLVLLSTFLIDHFELFGLQQVFANLTGREPAAASFKTPLLYRIVRHPLYMGLLIAFWVTPHMSVGHLIFAVATTGYIIIGAWLEERDLATLFGDTYRQYKQRVPMVVPFTRVRRMRRPD